MLVFLTNKRTVAHKFLADIFCFQTEVAALAMDGRKRITRSSFI